MEQTASLGCIPMHWLPLGWTDTYPACSCCWGRHTHGPCTALPSAVGILPQTTQRGSSEHFSPTKLLACFPHQCWWIKEPFQEAQFYDIGAKSRCGWKPEGSVIFWRMCFFCVLVLAVDSPKCGFYSPLSCGTKQTVLVSRVDGCWSQVFAFLCFCPSC